tara:strand:+ start:91 stop:261 length:171 start_codon:yes stop_codon:yes gene_type:complete
MTTVHDLKFEYDHDTNRELNFDKWYRWNCRERRSYPKEIEYTKAEALEVFDSLYPK